MPFNGLRGGPVAQDGHAAEGPVVVAGGGWVRAGPEELAQGQAAQLGQRTAQQAERVGVRVGNEQFRTRVVWLGARRAGGDEQRVIHRVDDTVHVVLGHGGALKFPGHVVEGVDHRAEFIMRADRDALVECARPDALDALQKPAGVAGEARRKQPAQPKHRQQQPRARPQQARAQRRDGREGLARVHLREQHPLHVRDVQRCPRTEHRLVAVVADDARLAGAPERIHRGLSANFEIEDRGLEAADAINLVGGPVEALQHLGEALRVFEQEARVRAHLEVRAKQIRLPRFAQPLLRPMLVAGHHAVDFVDRHLREQDADLVLAVEDRGTDERRWRGIRRPIGLVVRQLTELAVGGLERVAEQAADIGARIRTIQQARRVVRLLEDGVHDVSGPRIDEKYVVESETIEERSEDPVRLGVREVVSGVVGLLDQIVLRTDGIRITRHIATLPVARERVGRPRRVECGGLHEIRLEAREELRFVKVPQHGIGRLRLRRRSMEPSAQLLQHRACLRRLRQSADLVAHPGKASLDLPLLRLTHGGQPIKRRLLQRRTRRLVALPARQPHRQHADDKNRSEYFRSNGMEERGSGHGTCTVWQPCRWRAWKRILRWNRRRLVVFPQERSRNNGESNTFSGNRGFQR